MKVCFWQPERHGQNSAKCYLSVIKEGKKSTCPLGVDEQQTLQVKHSWSEWNLLRLTFSTSCTYQGNLFVNCHSPVLHSPSLKSQSFFPSELKSSTRSFSFPQWIYMLTSNIHIIFLPDLVEKNSVALYFPNYLYLTSKRKACLFLPFSLCVLHWA